MSSTGPWLPIGILVECIATGTRNLITEDIAPATIVPFEQFGAGNAAVGVVTPLPRA